SDTEEIRMDKEEVAIERTSEDTEEMATVLTSMDAATVLAGGIDVPTDSYSIPIANFKGMTFEEIEAKFVAVWKLVENFIHMGSKEEAERLKSKGFNLEQEKAKKQMTSEEVPDKEKSPEEIPEEKVKEMMRPALSDKEMELWVELKRLYEPNPEDQLWAQTHNYMHAPIEWKLYNLSGVHHVTAKDKEIFMLVEKDYPLRKGLALVMISYKLQVENYSQMAEDLIRKMYNIANSPRQQGS
nr:hypothetical protein [Tanacetum cinerariifolium]